MPAGFANQQLARNLARSTVEGRENTVRAFANYVRKRRRPQDRPTSAVVGFCLCYRKSRSARAARSHRTPRRSRPRRGQYHPARRLTDRQVHGIVTAASVLCHRAAGEQFYRL
jgi:hypothetical protein